MGNDIFKFFEDKNLENVKIIDCSWHMPNVDRDPFKEYKAQHIKNAIWNNYN